MGASLNMWRLLSMLSLCVFEKFDTSLVRHPKRPRLHCPERHPPWLQLHTARCGIKKRWKPRALIFGPDSASCFPIAF